jgi:2'-5' RNA ligase
MITPFDVELLKREVNKGRGLWVGLMLTPGPRIHEIQEFLPDDPHITLLHLGKNRSVIEVEAIVDIVTEVEANYFLAPMKCDITGAGWFFRKEYPCLVALVNSPELVSMRANLINRLRENDVQVWDSFGFIPHVTLKNLGIADLTIKLGRAKQLPIYFPTLHIVCGDVKMAVSK